MISPFLTLLVIVTTIDISTQSAATTASTATAVSRVVRMRCIIHRVVPSPCRYTAESQRLLPIHTDQSQVSLTIALNSCADYDGGGTYFLDSDITVNCDIGAVVAFPGAATHGGAAITRGVRYIIAVFLYQEEEPEANSDVNDEQVSAHDTLLVLKRATPSDAEEVMAVVNAAYAVEIGSTGVAFKSCNRYTDVGQTLADIEAAVASVDVDTARDGSSLHSPSSSSIFIVARRLSYGPHGPVIGCIRAEVRSSDCGERVCEFGPFAVAPTAQGEGVGAALLQFVEAHARTLGATRMEIHVVNHRSDAIAW